MSIVVQDDNITIKGEELDLVKAIELKKVLEKFQKDGCTSLTLSMRGVKHLSGTGFQVIASLRNRFDSFKVEGAELSITERLRG